MNQKTIYIGESPQKIKAKEIEGQFVEIDNEAFYKISNYDLIPPFFMSIVSDSDHWMFISSNGGLTAGRRNSDSALFPYYTDDKICDSAEQTGCKTIFLIEKNGKNYLWEPFSQKQEGAYVVNRNVYKNFYCNKIIFEEVNQDLELTFSYGWYNSDRFGFIKRSQIKNHGSEPLKVNFLDGVQNILPYGVNEGLQNVRSNLVNAYKKNELLKETGIGLFLLSSIIVDKPEPSEALKATSVWSAGLDDGLKLISSRQLDNFRSGLPITEEVDIRAERGAYFIQSGFTLSQEQREWYFVAEVNQGPSDISALEKLIREEKDLPSQIESDIKKGTENMMKIMGNADGLQVSEDPNISSRHFSNVLFNVMRGGIFDNDYMVETPDLTDFISKANKTVFSEAKAFLDSLPYSIEYPELIEKAASVGDPHLARLCFEYLPLTFSRRHGDPSRPWNRFSIDTKKEDGSKILNYEGNWRDIFQNWEALGVSFPEYIESMITKFVNASTMDGYNPYRITRNGIDWEVIEPDDPWSFIGYWGDHQIIYQLKFLEISQNYHPNRLQELLTREMFVYANIPYKIKDYKDLLKNPQDTIIFDTQLEEIIQKRVSELGSDGKLVLNNKDDLVLVNLTEKLLVSHLAKLSNFIPEIGIWLNTQRPEWNDANNALVGYGVSMVTLYYLRRSLAFCSNLFGSIDFSQVELSREVSEWLKETAFAFESNKELLNGTISNQDRRLILDQLGNAAEKYRVQVYKGFSEEKESISVTDLNHFFQRALEFMDHSIKANQREDKLFHAYNLMKVESDGGISVSYLYEMLEGQVAALSSGSLTPQDTIQVLDALKESAVFREDQYSYLLYPDRNLPRFKEKNNIPLSFYKESKLLQKLVEDGNMDLIEVDISGDPHFNGSFNNATSVEESLDELSRFGYKDLVSAERGRILEVFEEMFDHRSFTGRSGTFFGYEGLGSIYWHMVSKLLLAAQETYFWALESGADQKILSRLMDQYYDIRAGIGFNKTPENYGGFPMDPYSHTPGNAGAQQPGMTGQVKEDILARNGELGITVKNGCIEFYPTLLKKDEFLSESKSFSFWGVNSNLNNFELPKGSLFFSFCQVPVIYELSDQNKILVQLKNGETKKFDGSSLDPEVSATIFKRTGEISQINVLINQSKIQPTKL